ncbi:hypothetical protein BBO99_00001330 [Phytophthora kernoviae]|uniref:Uncharacterized protein n=2 Tax=Phytophthora kernoviae TaxID=325452 RepID=A0A3R7MM68_9STRA|nr:hypothetical protein G195_002317 [Phytophthora kernoviae 00238/432]KAG2529602.1 hypothetical protein JM16_001986 [Phytophthora kernoviae]KAG2530786.1 hypothetical protein JM18_001162 [Phytophthora kernoviae]RLN10272.1 hypothetical protein BBI17_001181 [Phytophthora kernoviae]RLN84406.1 hypothetical protein BBO99_00001330 [Phytophthora kernoviae]
MLSLLKTLEAVGGNMRFSMELILSMANHVLQLGTATALAPSASSLSVRGSESMGTAWFDVEIAALEEVGAAGKGAVAFGADGDAERGPAEALASAGDAMLRAIGT